MEMLQNPYVRSGLAAAALIMAAKFIKDERVKAACYGAAGVVILKRVPVIGDSI